MRYQDIDFPFVFQIKKPTGQKNRVLHILELGSHSLIIGRVEETYILESCLTDGNPDIVKINPFIYTGLPTYQYYTIGEFVAKGHSIGRELISGK